MPETAAEIAVPLVFPSVEEVEPDEEGGPIARDGFNYQDEIVVSFIIDMLEDSAILKLHCETHDDMVIIRRTDDLLVPIAEYVQVKATKEDKLWSMSDLCQRESKVSKTGTTSKPSIFETSFHHDKHHERSQFRIVTLRPVVKELKPLTYRFEADGRKPDCEEMKALSAEFKKRFPILLSAKENDTDYWLTHCFWDERDSEKAIRDDNFRRLMLLSQVDGRLLLPEYVDLLLDELRSKVKLAGAARWKSGKEKKILTSADLRRWWEKRIQEVADGVLLPIGGKLRDKMDKAKLPEEVIRMAIELRREYAANIRTPRYMESEVVNKLQSRAKSEIASLRACFIANPLSVDSLKFHASCLDCMDRVNAAQPENSEDQSAFLKGFLYDIADRCLLRFDGPTP